MMFIRNEGVQVMMSTPFSRISRASASGLWTIGHAQGESVGQRDEFLHDGHVERGCGQRQRDAAAPGIAQDLRIARVGVHEVHQVALGDLHALGPAGGAGGINAEAQVVGADRRVSCPPVPPAAYPRSRGRLGPRRPEGRFLKGCRGRRPYGACRNPRWCRRRGRPDIRGRRTETRRPPSGCPCRAMYTYLLLSSITPTMAFGPTPARARAAATRLAISLRSAYVRLSPHATSATRSGVRSACSSNRRQAGFCATGQSVSLKRSRTARASGEAMPTPSRRSADIRFSAAVAAASASAAIIPSAYRSARYSQWKR